MSARQRTGGPPVGLESPLSRSPWRRITCDWPFAGRLSPRGAAIPSPPMAGRGGPLRWVRRYKGSAGRPAYQLRPPVSPCLRTLSPTTRSRLSRQHSTSPRFATRTAGCSGRQISCWGWTSARWESPASVPPSPAGFGAYRRTCTRTSSPVTAGYPGESRLSCCRRDSYYTRPRVFTIHLSPNL